MDNIAQLVKGHLELFGTFIRYWEISKFLLEICTNFLGGYFFSPRSIQGWIDSARIVATNLIMNKLKPF